ncbi:NAD(P)/FAD-dependent oxidoreductase [Rhodoferax sp.]|uniref:NAD(P)/FAD-dependent oxidoreductase n=1 Tax=Rhodoferax sp. TaxID=50421 RepID=UPI00271A7EAE|nr:NAD(P)/FAD-dependent oxidoreductase [Rhodoferax sp.]MDO8320405.1 NAD(P)/FAD-dependent oxidoreductase [Rhodoferax sp.]MDP2681001.1 NAD(P)/FAD-dependent oxidoreductase [Rhodoferax sp.]
MPQAAIIATDALVIGAGPVGLFQVFQLGLQGIQTQVVDVLDQAGGQCIELYPDKPIYDIPALPYSTGRDLTQRLLDQVAPFKPTFHFKQQVSQLLRQPDGRWQVSTPQQQFLTRTLFIAAGVGAFVPKELKVEGLAAFTGSQLFYRLPNPEQIKGRNMVVLGGEDAAVDNAIAMTESPHQAVSVTLVHRRDVLQASPQALEKLAQLRASGHIKFVAGQITGIETRGDRLTAIAVSTPDNQTLNLPLDALLVNQGISPKLGPVAQWGLVMERKQLSVDPASFATSEAGIYAVGDINSYPGKKKLIVCGFHEATLAAFAAASYLNPQASGVLQYTTSSALLQQRLGIKPV